MDAMERIDAMPLFIHSTTAVYGMRERNLTADHNAFLSRRS